MPSTDATNDAHPVFLDPLSRGRTAQTRRGPGSATSPNMESPMNYISTSGSNATLNPILPSIGNVRKRSIVPPEAAIALSVDAVIFDVDGVIADTAERHADSWRRVAYEEGLEFDDTMADSLRGLSRAASLKHILGDREVSPELFAELMERKNRYYVASLDSLSPSDAMPGIHRLMRQFAAMNVKCAAASASKNARLVLDRISLVEEFDAIVDGNEVGRPKPAPDLFLRAAARLRIKPNRCVVLEDAAAGIAAARAAAMRTIGIGDPDRLCAAMLVLPTLDETDARSLIEMLDAASS